MDLADAQVALAMNDPTEGSLAELAKRLANTRATAAALREVAAAIELELAARMEGDTLEVPGVGTLYREYTRRSTWRDDSSSERMREDVREQIAAEVARDVMTGEINPALANVVRAAINLAYEALPAPSSLKSAGARRLGLRVDDYRQFSDVARVSVVGPGDGVPNQGESDE